VGSCEWLPETWGLLYTELDDAGRPARVLLHYVKGASCFDRCLLVEHDTSAYLDVSKTKARELELFTTCTGS
jgi:protease II